MIVLFDGCTIHLQMEYETDLIINNDWLVGWLVDDDDEIVE